MSAAPRNRPDRMTTAHPVEPHHHTTAPTNTCRGAVGAPDAARKRVGRSGGRAPALGSLPSPPATGCQAQMPQAGGQIKGKGVDRS